MIAIPDSYVMLTCAHCGHTADLFDFCKTPITGELPDGTHQCPACRKAWRMEVVEPGRWIGTSYFIPAKRKAVQIPTIL